MSSFWLKMIAMATMVVDHTAYAYQQYLPVPVYVAMRAIGRTAMPIFCFLIAEGFIHTKDVKKYLLRLFVFALISEAPFDLLFNGTLYSGIIEFKQGQNVFFTLLLGLAAITLFERLARAGKFSAGFVCVSLCCVAAYLIRCDYSIFGVLFVFAFYYFRGKRVLLPVVFCVLVAGVAANSLIGGNALFAVVSLCELFALPFILSYNGTPGPSSKKLKMSFYMFYPLHISLLFLSVIYVSMALQYAK